MPSRSRDFSLIAAVTAGLMLPGSSIADDLRMDLAAIATSDHPLVEVVPGGAMAAPIGRNLRAPTVVGPVQLSTGMMGHVLEFGGRDALVVTSDSGLSSLTLSAWVNWDGGHREQLLASLGGRAEEPVVVTVSDGRLMVRVTGPDNAGEVVGPKVLEAGVWHHVAITVDTGTRGIKVYVDRDLRASGSVDHMDHPLGPVIMGDPPGPDRGFDGMLDAVRLDRRALVPRQVAALADRPTPLWLRR